MNPFAGCGSPASSQSSEWGARSASTSSSSAQEVASPASNEPHRPTPPPELPSPVAASVQTDFSMFQSPVSQQVVSPISDWEVLPRQILLENQVKANQLLDNFS